MVALEDLRAHPRNPRLSPREDVIEAIQASLSTCGFDPAHALIIRPLADGYEIISGHHRWQAAQRAGIAGIPCWVRQLDDDAAYMLLATSNAQGELSPLERGMHALNSGRGVREYARDIGRDHALIVRERQAAEVVTQVTTTSDHLGDKTKHLSEIHTAPVWLWSALVSSMLAKGWNVEQTRQQVARVKDVPTDPPEWIGDDVAAAIVDGAMRPGDIVRMVEAIDACLAEIDKLIAEEDELNDKLPQSERLWIAQPELPKSFATYVDVNAWCDAIIGEARRLVQALRRKVGEAEGKASQLLEYVSLEQWKQLDEATKAALLPPDRSLVSVGQFTKQESDAIEWAQWSWNPITGCLHDCPYCYARDIATSARVAKVYPNGFAPTLRPRSLLVPRTMQVPLDAARDTRYRNVFTGSMADIFGRWVPDEWINAVLTEIRNAPQWNFLCLTKFPKRMAEFDIPDNAWMGTTVDLQARVPAAESAFETVGSKVKWLSVEPLIEPLKFKHLDRFNWIVIGGASRSAQTPEWHPPTDWIEDLKRQARDAGLAVYEKTNLWGNRTTEMPFDAPIKQDPKRAPDVFHYLGRKDDAA